MIALGRTARHSRTLHRRNGFRGSGVARLHHQPIFAGIVLHAAEDDDAVAGCCNLVAEKPEPEAEAEASDLAFDQPLGGLHQRSLRLANAHRERAAFGLASLDQEFAEEMRFSRAASTV